MCIPLFFLCDTDKTNAMIFAKNYACPKRGLIHRDRESYVIRPLLYLQATKAGYSNENLMTFICDETRSQNCYQIR